MSRHAIRATLVACVGACAVLAGPADGQLQVGATVPDVLSLSITRPGAFHRLAGTDVYELRIPVRVTSTLDDASLGVADGQDFKPPARGRLRAGGRLASAPLEVAVARGVPQSLGSTYEPIVMTWHKALSLAPATIVVRQTVPSGSAGVRGHKIVLITLASQTP